VSPDWEALAAETGLSATELSRRGGRSVGEALPSTMLIAVGEPLWDSLIGVHQIRLAAHEYFHVLQFRLSGPAATRSFFRTPIGAPSAMGPNWLLEGSAEYFSWRVMQDAELLRLNDYLARLDQKDDVDPAELETYLEFIVAGQDSYDASLRAVAFLLQDKDEQALLRYFFAVGQATPWQTAFASAFGLTIEAFYRDYGAYIASR
jgi:hypothetical protein